MLGESFAMAAEYFAACAVSGAVHAWFFSISSYRRRTQKKKAIGELIERFGFEPVCRAVLLAFLYNNFLVDRLDRTRRSEEHTSELQSQSNLVCRLLLEKK